MMTRLSLVVLTAVLAPGRSSSAASSTMTDITLIVVDDLRPELDTPYYKCDHVPTPNLNAIANASDAVTFTRAYAQIALCAPSRNSFLTGRSPDATGAYNFVEHFRLVGPDWTTLPQFFKRAGYLTVGAGKVFHPDLPPNWDLPMSWDTRLYDGEWDEWLYPSEPKCPAMTSWCSINSNKTKDFIDTQTTERADALLENSTLKQQPLFLAVGFRKPHLLWRFPQRIVDKFFDVLGDDDASNITISPNQFLPENAPDVAFHVPFDELKDFADVQACGGIEQMSPTTAFPKSCQQKWRRAYYASVAFVDEQIGDLMEMVDQKRQDVTRCTVILGDHGWHLGDAAEWEKFTNFENGVRVPLVVRHPSLASSSSRLRDDLVELVDLFPTIVGLVPELDISYVNDTESAPLDGRDLFANFTGAGEPPQYARSQFPRCVGAEEYNVNHTVNTSLPLWDRNDCNDVTSSLFTHMGYSLRDLEFRFTAWFEWDGATLKPADPDAPIALELYDHRGDDGTCEAPSAFDGPFEATNLAFEPDFSATVARFLDALPDAFPRTLGVLSAGSSSDVAYTPVTVLSEDEEDEDAGLLPLEPSE